MGIDLHTLNFLRYASAQKKFQKTITIGRQGIHLIEPVVRRVLPGSGTYRHQEYCEDLLQEYFGASAVESIDNSSFESATHVIDMNQPLPRELEESYDTVIDGGCLEHIFNVPQALQNCSLLCRPGGQILHILPANNFCGHGFWQFSPELFFSLYSEKNGYARTEVFLADLRKPGKWFKVIPPTNGQRVNVYSSTELYVLVRTTRVAPVFAHKNVQQSDYIHEWNSGVKTDQIVRESRPIRRFLKSSPLLHAIFAPPYHAYLRLKSGLNKSNAGLIEVQLKTLFS